MKNILFIMVLLFLCTAASANLDDCKLVQINSTYWYFESEQTSLSAGEYNYQTFANNISSDYRVMNIDTMWLFYDVYNIVSTDGTVTYSTDPVNITVLTTASTTGTVNISVNTAGAGEEYNFTVNSGTVDWLNVTSGLTLNYYDLKYSNGTFIESQAVSSGSANFTTNLVTGTYIINSVSPTISAPTLTPSTLHYNSTGTFNVSWIVETNGGGLNNTTVSMIWKPQHPDGFYNWSWRWITNQSPDGWKADNRNDSANPLNFETNTTITNRTIYEYAGCDENCTRMKIIPINSTHTYVNFTGYIQDTVHLNSHYINRKEMQEASKTVFSIYKNHDFVAKVFDPESYAGHNHTVGLYIDVSAFSALTPTYDLLLYIGNSSWNPTGSDNLLSSNVAFITSFNTTTWQEHVYQPHANSSYICVFFNTSELVINLTDSGYYHVVLRSNTPSSKSYNVNVTNIATSTNKSFADLGVMWYGSDAPYTTYAYTPNMFLDASHTDMQWYTKLYVADNNGVWGNSTESITNIDVSVFPPTTSSICSFVYDGAIDSDMNSTYSGTYDVRVLTSSDPDGGTVTSNLTIHYKNETFVGTVNGSIPGNGGDCINISFDSTAYYSDTEEYTLRVVATDDESSTSTYWLPVNFTLNSTISFSNDAVSPVTVLQGHTSTVSIDVNDTVGTLNSVIVKIRNVNYSMSLSSGDTWTYAYSDTFVGTHYVTNFYATDDASDTNSTTSSLYITVLDSSGSGGGAGTTPTPTPTATPIPTATPPTEVPKANITVPHIFDIVTGKGLSMFKINFGTDDPVYSKTMNYTGIESCTIIDGNLLASCDVYDSQVRVDVQPPLKGIYNYHTGHVRLVDEDADIHDIPVEIITIDVMGWVEVPRVQIDGLPFVLFEKEPTTGDVIGVRLWWIFGLLGVGLLKFGRDKRKKAA